MQLRHEPPPLGPVPVLLGALTVLGGGDLGDALAAFLLELVGRGLHLREAAEAFFVEVGAVAALAVRFVLGGIFSVGGFGGGGGGGIFPVGVSSRVTFTVTVMV